MWRREEVIQKLKSKQGGRSLRGYAQSIGCSAAYLSDVYLGRRDPGPKLLGELGLESHKETTVVYKKARKWK